MIVPRSMRLFSCYVLLVSSGKMRFHHCCSPGKNPFGYPWNIHYFFPSGQNSSDAHASILKSYSNKKFLELGFNTEDV